MFTSITCNGLEQQGVFLCVFQLPLALIMKNHVRQNHTTIQVNFKKNSYITIMQLSPYIYDVVINELPC